MGGEPLFELDGLAGRSTGQVRRDLSGQRPR